MTQSAQLEDARFDLGKCKTCGRWAQRLNWDKPSPRPEDKHVIGHAPDCAAIGDASAFDEDYRVTTTDRSSGYGHATSQGTCGPKVTAQDIAHLKYHSYFGGRGAWAKDGRWGATTHTD